MLKIIKKQQIVATVVTTDKNGVEHEETEVLGEVIVDKPMANVGVKLGTTKNLGDYNSLRVDVTLFMPSETDKKSIDKTFKKVYKWVDKRLDNIMDGV